jgi:RNA polymerase sigma factor (sigma-70 family)
MNTTGNISDEKLIRYYLSGNPHAMATLVELYKDRVYSVIYAMVHDRSAAEVIFRDVFIKIIDNLLAGKSADEGDFLPWAIGIAQNLCEEHSFKKKSGIATAGFTSILDESAENHMEHPVPTGNFYHDSHGKIKTLIDKLPDDQREVIILKHYGGLTFREIADIKQCSLTNALDMMKSGLNNLCNMMSEKEMVMN